MGEYLCIINCKNPENTLKGFTELSGKGYYAGIRGKYKFENDCILKENSQVLILLVGVIFNKRQLLLESKKESWFQAIKDLYLRSGESFFTRLKGSFNGIIFDKIKNKWVVFSNIQSERPVFYSAFNEEFIIASGISIINEIFHSNKSKLSLNIDGAYMLLSHGFMLGGYTLYNEVKRIKAGFYLVLEQDIVVEKDYYRFSNLDCTIQSKYEIIENVDYLFLEAVKLQFEKDREYKFRHITSLSGGLDSRMTVFCAHELGYTDQLNITFSQSEYLEQTIACQIATKLKHEWIFKSLDNGLFLYDLDNITRLTGGNVMYYAVAIEFRLFSLLNIDSYGLMHTGQLGSLYPEYPGYIKPSISDGAYSKKLTNKISENVINIDDYEDAELFLIHNRYLNGTNYGLAGILAFTETFSPFYDLEFWEYCLRIPLKYRYNHNIYKQWVIKKHAFAAEFIWEKTGAKITNNLRDKLRLYHNGRAITFADAVSGFYRRMARNFNLRYKPSLWGMNPFDSWLLINDDLNLFVKGYFEENISLLDNYPELKSDCNDLFKNGNGLEKIQVISLLSAIKTYC